MFSDTVKQAAAGQWDTLLQQLAGLSEAETTPSKIGRPCPHCGGTDRYEFKNVDNGHYLCRGCGAGDGWSMLMKRLGVDFGECLSQVAQHLGIMLPSSKGPLRGPSGPPARPGPAPIHRSEPEDDFNSPVAHKARVLWQRANPAPVDHPYLVKKKLPPLKLKQHKSCLVSALYDRHFLLVNLQFISADGQKRYLRGGQTKGCFQIWSPGWPSRTVYLCEGMADALATYCYFQQCRQVIAAYSVSNMITLGPWLREQMPDRRLIAVLDNDAPTAQRPWRPGAAALLAHDCFDEVILPGAGLDAADCWLYDHER